MKKITSELLYFLTLLVSGFIVIFLYYYHHYFANTNFFFASTTFIVGSFALFIYTKQKSDEKSNAATTVLLEIRNAESKISIISEKLYTSNHIDFPSVLQINSWRKYSHLFVRDLDQDELQLINTFYSACEIIEDLVIKQNNFVWIAAEERAKVVQQMLAKIHDEFQKKYPSDAIEAQNTFNNSKLGITKYYTDETYSYAPSKCIDGLKFQIETVGKITTTTCGSKLKKLAY